MSLFQAQYCNCDYWINKIHSGSNEMSFFFPYRSLRKIGKIIAFFFSYITQRNNFICLTVFPIPPPCTPWGFLRKIAKSMYNANLISTCTIIATKRFLWILVLVFRNDLENLIDGNSVWLLFFGCSSEFTEIGFLCANGCAYGAWCDYTLLG